MGSSTEEVTIVRLDPQMSEGTHARRDRVLEAVERELSERGRLANEMQEVIEGSGASFDDVAAEFEDTDDVFLAVVERVAARLVRPLASDPRSGGSTLDAVRDTLVRFGSGLDEAYGSIMVGIHRVGMTECFRRRELRGRLYEAGPSAIADALRGFLERANGEGSLAIDDCDLAAESLLGMLREPLYMQLALHKADLNGGETGPDRVEAAVDLFLNGCTAEEEKVDG